MDPLTLIGLAGTIAQATGLDRYIGAKLGGDAGAEVASRIVDAAQVVTGASTPDEAIAAINKDASLLAELKLKILDMENQEAERILADRKDARAMQVAALQQDDPFAKRFVYYFASVWSVFTMIYILVITLGTIPPDNQRFADTILGFMLGTLIATIINFFFGSSRQSHLKDGIVEALSNVMKKGP